MSVKSAALCLSVAIVGHPFTAHAESATGVIERYIKAIGGKKAVEQIASTELTASVSTSDGRSGVFTQRTRRPQLFSSSLSFGDVRWRSGFNGRAAWQDDDVDGLRTLYGAAASRVRAEATYANTRFLLSEKLNQVAVTGQDQVRGRAAIVVVAVSPEGVARRLFFDAETYLLVKDQQQVDGGVEERLFDDYRRVGQVMEPHRIEWRRNGETFTIAVERVTHNPPVDDMVFDVPVPRTGAPLDIEVVLSAAGRNERPAEDLLASYAYTISSTNGRIDRDGRITETEGTAWEVFHVGGRPVPRQVRKRGGEPLSEAERRREDERVNAVIRELERQRSSGQAGNRTPEERARSGVLVLYRMPLMSADWLPVFRRMCDFSNIRRERVRGRSVMVVEFEPKSRVAAKDDVERQAGTMTGTLWIDEASPHVMRMESYFRDDYERILQGSSLRVERILVNDEVWLPFRHESNLTLGFAFGNSSRSVSAVQYTDHKKFSVATDSAITLPKESN